MTLPSAEVLLDGVNILRVDGDVKIDNLTPNAVLV